MRCKEVEPGAASETGWARGWVGGDGGRVEAAEWDEREKSRRFMFGGGGGGWEVGRWGGMRGLVD